MFLFLSNIESGQQAFPFDFQSTGAIVALGSGNLKKSESTYKPFVAGVIGRAVNTHSSPAPAFGGWFENLAVNGLVLSTQIVEGNTSYTYLSRTTSMVVSISANQQHIYLPNNAYKGTVIWLKQWSRGFMRVYPRYPNKLFDDDSENAYIDVGEGWTAMCIFVDNITVNSSGNGFWLFSKFKF